MQAKYGAGIVNAWQAAAVKEKICKTKLENHGSKMYNNRSKAEESCLKKYGVKCTSQVPAIRSKQQHRYVYNGIAFDSMPEIAFYIWLNDVKDILNIDFAYSPNISFKYVHDGKTHLYFPDFKVEDQLFELKGDQFFTEDGKMTCPYRDATWSDAEYAETCALYEAKHQCMLRNNVHILRSGTYKFFIDYVHQAYGQSYLKQFKKILKKQDFKS